MSTEFKGKIVTSKDIIKAIKNFNDQYNNTNLYDSWLDKGNYKFAIQIGENLYPCKHILSEATGISTAEFGGGHQTNSVLKKLGFQVIDKPTRNS